MKPVGCQDGAEIRRLRELRQYPVGKFARRIGVRSQSLSNIESGRRPAGAGTLIRIARELEVPVEAIIRPDLDDSTDDEPAGAVA
jgi:transcriptional regulator with XRE-family HTH domain